MSGRNIAWRSFLSGAVAAQAAVSQIAAGGSFLSCGLAGHIYGAEAIWGADVQPQAPIKMWDAFEWSSATQMKYLRTFAFSIGRRYQDLIPDEDWVSPNKTQTTRGYKRWAYAAHTADKEIILAYFEKGCPQSIVRALRPSSTYRAEWFDPRNGMDRCRRRICAVKLYRGACASAISQRHRLGATPAVRWFGAVRGCALMFLEDADGSRFFGGAPRVRFGEPSGYDTVFFSLVSLLRE